MLDAARGALDQSLGRVDGMIKRGQATDRQVERERWHAADRAVCRHTDLGCRCPEPSPDRYRRAGMCRNGWRRAQWASGSPKRSSD